jgi:hypothetical protein
MYPFGEIVRHGKLLCTDTAPNTKSLVDNCRSLYA